MDPLESHLTLAVMIPVILQWLKGQNWFPLLNYHNGTLNRIISWSIGALAGLGIGISYNSTAGMLTITGLTMAGLATGIQHAIVQIALNHGMYKAIVAPPLPGIQQAIQRDNGGSVPALVPPPPPPSKVGDPINNSHILFSVKNDDTTKVGSTVVEARGTFLKQSETVYEKTN